MVAVLNKIKLNYLRQKIWFLIRKPQQRLSVKESSISYANKFFKIYFKLQKLNLFFINNVKLFFSDKETFSAVYSKNQNKFIFVKRISIKEKNLKESRVHLSVTFAKKNTFFNVSSPKGKTVHSTTVVRQGYLGKKRKAYTSIFSVALAINKLISNFYINKYCSICITYKG
jgi:hypothetical protein